MKLEKKLARAKLLQEFHAEADRRLAEIMGTGEAIPWADMRVYLRKRMADTTAKLPTARKR